MKQNKKSPLLPASLLLCLLCLLLSIGLGSVSISPLQGLQIMTNQLWGRPLPSGLDPVLVSIFWSIRLPRALTAFLVGGALSVSGAVMQSLLQNPLASSYTMGVSSGASLGAALVIFSGLTLPVLGANFTLPAIGFLFGLGTVLLAIGFARRLDHSLQNQTVILVGMVISLFVNAILTLVNSLDKANLQQLVVWQMGSFSAKGWFHVRLLTLVLFLGSLAVLYFHRELDAMTFGQEQSMAMGVNVRGVKLVLLVLAALLTGVSVCFTGTIGFVDLAAPHVVRRLFGSRHRVVLPLSFAFGGAFMTLCDMLARTVLSPVELPVGAVTALFGAPFFCYVFFRKGKPKGLH